MEMNIYLRTLQRGWWIIVLMMLAAMNFSLLVSYLTPPIYEASSRFVVSPNAAVYSNSWDIVDSLDTLDRRSIINTYKELLAGQAVYGDSPELVEMGQDELAKYSIVAVVIPDTNILKLTVEGPDPNGVVLVAKAVGTEALDYINKLYPVYNFNILDDPEVPIKPIRPEPVNNAALALLIGAVLGTGLAFSREQLQNSFVRLKERSIVDPVSSAYNRSYFERRLREEVIKNPDATLSLGFINFRGIEESMDVIPQAMIDRAIYKVTETLKSELRGRDIVGRWDRTQLSVLLPYAPNAAIESTFKRIQKHLEVPIQLNETGDIIIRPDPCIGVVSRDQFESADSMLNRAKMAMDQASSFGVPTVIFLSTPFILEDGEQV